MKLKKGDKVLVIAGENKGCQGTIIKTLEKTNRVLVQGDDIKKSKKHMRPTQANPDGGIVSVDRPIHASNVMLLDPKEGKATRVGYKTVTEKNKKTNVEVVKKVRYAKKSGEIL